MRPGYVCYQDRGNLIALDPLSGRHLWRRTDIPAADLTYRRRGTVSCWIAGRNGFNSSVRSTEKRWLNERFDGGIRLPLAGRSGRSVTKFIQSHGTQLSRIDLLNDQVEMDADRFQPKPNSCGWTFDEYAGGRI